MDASADVRTQTGAATPAPGTSLGHHPQGPWVFDETVTQVFSDMLRRSIPDYETMRQAVTRLAIRFRRRDTDIVDLGASRGDGVAPLVRKWGAHNRFVLIEQAPAMVEVLRERYGLLEKAGVVQIHEKDLRHGLPPARASVVLCVLTLQFLPIEHRATLLQRIQEDLLPGGALILVEKCLASTREMDALFVDQYYQLKRDNGYTDAEIDAKRVSLENVLVPLRAAWNEDLLHSAGFAQIERFWQWMNFAGWVAVKG